MLTSINPFKGLSHILRLRIARHLVFDGMIIVGATTLALIVVDYRHRETQRTLSIEATRNAVRLMQANVDMHAALERQTIESIVFPEVIETLWFDEEIPTNHLLTGRRPWVEIAADDERALRHPRNPTVEGGEHAMFWYNPANGVVRARVPRTLSDAEAIALYNEVNGVRINELTALSNVEERE